jgi:hypothetical protein
MKTVHEKVGVAVAGRIVSAGRMALAGIRAQCAYMTMGQAIIALAALAVQRGIPSKEIDSRDIVAFTVEHGPFLYRAT